MKIIKLKAENIKKLSAVEITPEGNVVKITGRNEQGKTSVLDCIEMALRGADAIPSRPVRKGQKNGSIALDLGDLIVHRTFTETGSTLHVESKEGARYKSPQSMLDGLLGRLSFDPLEFLRAEPKRQFETVRQLTGITFDDLEGRRVKAFEQRTIENRDAKRLESQAAAIVVVEGGPTVEVSITDKVEAIDAAVTARNAHLSLLDQVKNYDKRIEDGRAYINGIEQQIAQLQQKLIDSRAHLDSLQQARDDTHGTAMTAGLDLPDIAVMQEELKTTVQQNEQARNYQQWKKLRDELATVQERAKNLTTDIANIDAEKLARIQDAKFPLDGLSFGDGEILYRELPLNQASSAEKLRVSLAMAMALNPKLRVIRITDGSLLDTVSLAIVEEMAKAGDYQVWIEIVDESGKVGIVIDDGHVAAVNKDVAHAN